MMLHQSIRYNDYTMLRRVRQLVARQKVQADLAG